MPRTVQPVLRMMYERANPNVQEFVEVSKPDVGLVLRRWVDQFSTTPPRVSESPASTTQASANGGLSLKSSLSNLVSMHHDDGINYSLKTPNVAQIIRGLGWELSSSLKPVRLRRFSAKVHVQGNSLGGNTFEMQIFRMRGVPGKVVKNVSGQIVSEVIQYTPTPLLPHPARAEMPLGLVAPDSTADVVFDLSPFQLDIEHRNVPGPSASTAGEIPEIIFAIWMTNPIFNDGRFQWIIDNTSTRDYVGIGSFRDVTWSRPNEDPATVWSRTAQNQVPSCILDVDSYSATSTNIYTIALPKAPSADAATFGRAVFDRRTPDGTSTTLEISSGGSGGPWTVITDGQSLADLGIPKQATYHLRVVMNASSDGFRTPLVDGVGVEFRTLLDVSLEATVDPIPQSINVPFLEAAIGEGKVFVVRFGRKDYRDAMSDLLTAAAATQLEVDYYLGSTHPSVGREHWFHIGRYLVASATPTGTSEVIQLLSYAKTLKRKIPGDVETVNTIFVVASATTSQITTSTLPGTTVGGNEYDGQSYYIRFTKTSATGLAPGMIFPVAGSTDTTKLDFNPVMTGTPNAGDEFELHSATFVQEKMAWVNADPADIWWEILTDWRGIPEERIGRGDLGRVGRSGLPPRLIDREPTDAAARDKLKVSRTITDATSTDELIDQLSFIMGGTTVEICGQFVFRQIYDVRDSAGNVSIPAEAVAAMFDARDLASIDTPRGLEERVTTISCTYGVDTALGEDAAKPSKVVLSDADAVAHFTDQDIEEIGHRAIPDGIAAWCFNTYDGGLYLATTLCNQITRYASTGLRVWPFSAVNMNPELCVGDRVVVMTDKYTDYDPTTKTPIRGLWAFTLILVHAARNGRDFRGFMPGLSSAVPVKGGPGGVAEGAVGQPSFGNVTFDAAGNLLVSLVMGAPAGGGFRAAASTGGMPSNASVDGATFVPGTSATINLGGGWAAGATVYIKAIAYASVDAAGAKSLPSETQAKVAGGAAGNTFTGTPTQTVNYGADTVSIGWVWPGAPATFDVWVSELGGPFVKDGVGVAGSPHVYNSPYDLLASGGDLSDTIAVYIDAIIGGVVVATSPTKSVTYRAQ